MPSPETITPERAARLSSVLQKRQPTLTVVFENVENAHNISAVIRSCDAVGVLEAHGVYHNGFSFPHLELKSSAGARKWVDVKVHNSVAACYDVLRKTGFTIYTTHMASDAVCLYDLDLTQDIALVFGNEQVGVSHEARDLADGNVLIPQVGMVQSLNISVACAVSLYEAYRQRAAAGMYNECQIDPNRLDVLKKDWFGR